MVGARVAAVLTDVQNQVKSLEDKENIQKMAKHFLDDMKAAVESKHCHLCDQDIDDALIAKMEARIRDAESSYGGLTPDEESLLRSLQNRRASLEAFQFPACPAKHALSSR